MPPKKKVKEKGPPEKVYKFISRDDVMIREQKYQNHIANLRICHDYIEDAAALEAELQAQELLNTKWLEHLNCCPLPKPYIPPDIRLSTAKLKYFENDSVGRTINWLLSVNERSILSQNIFAKNLTRRALAETIKPDFGIEYSKNIEFCLQILKRIEYFLLDDVEIKKCKESILQDIKGLRGEIQKEIEEFFNRFTYRILSSEESYLNTVNAFTADYTFPGEHFQIHIWCLKNVPIRFSQLEEPNLIADLNGIKILLQIPARKLSINFVVRAIHLNFDHISEKSKSDIQEADVSRENLNAGIEDLTKCLTNEWKMQLEIQKRIRDDMLAKRKEYEEQMRLYEEQQEKNKKANKEEDEKKGAKKKKIAKPTKEPPLLADDMFPDVWEEFLEEEENQYKDYIKMVYDPKNMDLDPKEINLKKYFILGGVYQIYVVDKPIHFGFQSFDMTWHERNSALVIDRDAIIEPTSQFQLRRSTYRRMGDRSLSIKVQDDKPPLVDAKCPWYILIIELPEYMCYWGEPIVCQFQTITRVKQKEPSIPIVPSQAVKITTKASRHSTIAVPEPEPPPPPPYQSFNASILNIQRPSKENFLRSSLSNIHLAKTYNVMDMPARDNEGVLNIYDFPLSTLLNKTQIRDIQRHVLPRLISSFKFPKEIKEDEERAASQSKVKSKGGVLIKKRTDVGAEQGPEDAKGFYFGPKQDNPERVIAIFPPNETIRILDSNDDWEERENPKEAKTFLQLLEVINAIKWQYKLRVRNLLDLKAFKSKFLVVNKYIDRMQRKLKIKESMAAFKVMPSKIRRSTRPSRKKSSFGKSQVIINLDDVDKNYSVVKERDKEDEEVSDYEYPVNEEEEEEEKKEVLTYECWTTKHIIQSEFNREKHTIILQTDRLGYFGLAFKRYEHFPFKYWTLEPNPENPENEVIFTLDTQYVRCVLNISEKGIKGHVTEPTTKFIRNPKMYLILENRMSDYIEFKKIFKEKYLNIFADHDACYYIENGYFSEKHLSTELHTYSCMAVNSTQIKFSFSQWNRLAKRRDIILKFVQYQDLPENIVEVRITPEEAFFVETSELCSDNEDIINLRYNLTWRNITTCSDLHQLINSMYLTANELRCKNPKLIHFIRRFIFELFYIKISISNIYTIIG
ncbi:hypothetical protein DOY81_004666, partial [Sarcophaga bullata]